MSDFHIGDKVTAKPGALSYLENPLPDVVLYIGSRHSYDGVWNVGPAGDWEHFMVHEDNLLPAAKRPFKLGDVVQLTCGGISMTVTGVVGDRMYDGELRTTVAVDTGIPRQDFNGQRGPDCRHYAPECLVLVKAVDE